MSVRISIIVAVSDDDVIGTRPPRGDRGMLWKLPDDMARFKRLTTGHTVVMGSATYAAMGGIALPNRNNIIVTREVADDAHCAYQKWLTHRNGGLWCRGLQRALEIGLDLEHDTVDGEVFIAGGARIYNAALDDTPGGLPWELFVSRIYLTRVHTCAEAAFTEHRSQVDFVRFPTLHPHIWRQDRGQFHPADGRHSHAFTYTQLDRR